MNLKVAGRAAAGLLVLATVIVAVASPSPAFAASPPGSGPYRLIAAHSGKCVDVIGGSTANGGRIQQWTCNSNYQQHWYFENFVLGVYGQVWPRHAQNPQKCLDVYNAGTGNAVPLQQWNCNGSAQQKWALRGPFYVGAPWNTNAYQLVPSHAPSRCMDVTGGEPATGNGARLQTYGCFGGSTVGHWNQLFILVLA